MVFLTLASVVVYTTSDSPAFTKPLGLRTVLGPVDGYAILQTMPLDDAFFTFLELDDYTQTTYGKDGNTVNLYIGYFNSLAKISAAHSPLVCFPGQGWQVSRQTERSAQVNDTTLHFSEMVANLDDQQQLVLYWFQAQEKTSPSAYRNKINALLNRLSGESEEHSFVRVSLPIGKEGIETARKRGKEFIEAFYPTFLLYIHSS